MQVTFNIRFGKFYSCSLLLFVLCVEEILFLYYFIKFILDIQDILQVSFLILIFTKEYHFTKGKRRESHCVNMYQWHATKDSFFSSFFSDGNVNCCLSFIFSWFTINFTILTITDCVSHSWLLSNSNAFYSCSYIFLKVKCRNVKIKQTMNKLKYLKVCLFKSSHGDSDQLRVLYNVWIH